MSKTYNLTITQEELDIIEGAVIYRLVAYKRAFQTASELSAERSIEQQNQIQTHQEMYSRLVEINEE